MVHLLPEAVRRNLKKDPFVVVFLFLVLLVKSILFVLKNLLGGLFFWSCSLAEQTLGGHLLIAEFAVLAHPQISSALVGSQARSFTKRVTVDVALALHQRYASCCSEA